MAAQTEPVSRAEICDLFWPKDSERASRKKLREGLSRLRGYFNDPDIIITNNDSISVDFSRVYVDFHEFNAITNPLLTSSEMNLSDKLPDWCYDQLRKAINLCRGTEFLQGMVMPDSTDFENWVSFNNISYSYAREKIIQRLIDHSIAIGNFNEAVIWLEMAISSDPLNTDNSYLMLKCLKESGRDKEAEDYLLFLDNLYRKNQIETLPATLKVFRGREKSSPVNKPAKEDRIDWPTAERNQVPFVGRDEYLVRIRNAYHRGGILYITGDAGIGKNRLVHEFFDGLPVKPRLMFCTGKPMLHNPPLSPIVEGLKSMVTDADWQTLSASSRTKLHNLYYEYQSLALEQGTPPAPSLNSGYFPGLFEEIAALMIRLSSKRSLLMVIDIIQWCDDVTLEFLHYLNERQFFAKHGTLILIGRQEEPNPSLDVYVDRSILASRLEKIVLPPLTIEETAHLISLVRGNPLTDDQVHQIHDLTGGSPFFLVELLRSSDLDHLSDNDDGFLMPETIKAMVHEKLHQLSESGHNILQASSILGRSFLPEVLQTMLDISPEELARTLEELQRKSILQDELPSKPNTRYCFLQELVRKVLLEEISPARKKALHLSALQAIKKVKSKLLDYYAVAAFHYDQAGDKTNAFLAWCDAAGQAASVYNRDESYQAYQSALDLLPDLPEEDGLSLVCQLVFDWGDYAYDLADDQTCEKLYTMGLSIGEQKQHPLMIGVSLNGLARTAEMRGEIQKGLELNRQAYFYLEKCNAQTELVFAHTQEGILHELNSDYYKALDCFLRGTRLMTDDSQLRSLDARASLLIQLSMAYSLMGYPSKAEEVSKRAHTESRLVKRPSARVQAVTVMALAQHFQGDFKQSMENANSVYKLAIQLKLDWWIVLLDLVLARDHLAMGHLDESWYYASHITEVASPPNSWPLSAYGHAIKGDALRLVNDLSGAIGYYQKGSKNPFTEYQTLENYLLLGMTHCQNDQVEQGLDILRQVYQPTDACGLGSLSLAAGYLIDIYSPPGWSDPAVLEKILATAEELKERGFGDRWMNVAYIHALAQHRSGNLEEAKQLFSQLADSAHNIGHSWWELEACAGLYWVVDQSSTERKKLQGRIIEILDAIADRASRKEVSGKFLRYRRMIETSF